ncbi:MAG: hypothetical protein HZB55_15070 [Deltaproteobacteria bacterium]|nr:hypothetical protein [Deltaproteobacteria bacterium]
MEETGRWGGSDDYKTKTGDQELMQRAGTDYVTDVKIEESWWYGFVGTEYCTRLEATAYPYVEK